MGNLFLSSNLMEPVMKTVALRSMFVITIGLGLVCGGCADSELGTVRGTVQMDGKPLPNAVVTFYPLEPDVSAGKGGASYGRTDDAGEYELQYNRDSKGAEIGRHKVEISTRQESSGGDYGADIPETVPAKYNSQTTLTAEVASGHNTIDFLDLDSSGSIARGRGY